jgi:hypothetical protein
MPAPIPIQEMKSGESPTVTWCGKGASELGVRPYINLILMRSLSSMSVDITHEILLQVANRRDLLTLISCSHQYYDIFKLHPNSILRRVVCNETGILEEVLPYAWNALYVGHSSSLSLQDSLTVSMDPKCVRLLKSAQSVVEYMARVYSVR